LPSYFGDPEEVIRRLRARNQVVTYFGETDEERAKRLKLIEDLEPADKYSGSTDEFGKQLRKLAEAENAEKPALFTATKKEEPEKTKEEEADIDVNASLLSEAVTTREIFILAVLKKLLKLWHQELQDRPESQKKTSQGRIDTATFKQTKSHIKILFKQLKNRVRNLHFCTYLLLLVSGR
jgi:pre-mRNA-splicing factor 18